MKVAVYSGTFNPLHIGHKAIMSYLTEKMDFDCVYLIVSPKNPLKTSVSADSARARYEAACEAVGKYGLKAKVDDIELGMPAPQYTVRTLDALKAREPWNSFTLVIGADNLANLHNWKDYRKILSEYGIVVFPRDGFDAAALKMELEKELEKDRLPCRVRLAGAPLVNISSTEIRKGLAEGRDMSGYLM